MTTKQIDTEWDVIVVGAGLGGLTAAARMANSGLRVLVLEQHVYAGGYAHHFLRKVRGTDTVYDFDVALHQTGDLLPGRGMHTVLGKLGVLDRIRLRQFDIAYRTVGPDHDHQIPADADAYEALLAGAYPEHAGGIKDLFETFRAIDRPGDDGGLSPEAFACMGQSLEELLDAHVRDPRVQSVFATLWGYIGLVPAQMSAFIFARMWLSYHVGGCFYFEGGGQALSDAFVDVIEANGGKVVLRAEVASIETQAGRVVGVETKKHGRFRAQAVVSNAAAPLTFHNLLDDKALAKADIEVSDALPLGSSIHQAYVGIKGDATKLGLADRSVFYSRSYDFDEELRAVEAGDYARQGWMVGNHTLADPGHVPAGRSVLHSSLMADGRLWEGLDESAYRERKAELEAFLIDRLADAIPDVRDRIEICETGTPRTMQRYSMNPLGAIYGYAHTPTAHSVHRPQPRTSVPGLYLAGAWTFPGAGFTGTMSSGWNTAGLVFEDVEGHKP
ncbi:MAG: NAD(P)/FAD-dependent oxidoreductase [bacterium]|nr:NAD(P)/FAD-dependent oxidoreductase [bacterium]